jgi:PKD repeat protein
VSPDAGIDNEALDSVFQVRMRPQEPQEFPGRSISWASPLQLGNLLPEPDKLTSADDELKKDASSFEPMLPIQNVSAEFPPYAFFSPSWTAGSQSMEDLAYAMYRFSLEGYEVLPEETLGYAWDTKPSDYSNLWLGLGNTDTNTWDWFEGDADGVITIKGTGKYIDDDTDNLLLAVVLLGTDECVLTELRLGVHELRGTGGFASFPDGDGTPPLFGGALGSSIDLTPGCSPVNDQGVTGSCTAFAVGDAAYNYELGSIYGDYGWDFSNPFNLTSPRYLYVETGQDQGLGCPYEGRYTELVGDWLLLNGVATELNAPFGNPPEAGWCDGDWSSEALDDAALLDIEVWSSVNPRGETGVLNVKTILYHQQRPVIMQTGLDWDFMDYAPGEVWNYTGPVIGYHAMCIVGYDDNKDGGNGAFKVRNSWGDDWGEYGYCWIGYQTFIDVSPSLWCFALQDEYDATVAGRFCSGTPNLEPPTNLQASDGEHTDRIQLSWERSPDATGYKVYRDTKSIPIATLGDVDLWDDTTVADYFGHTYWLKATNATDESDYSASDVGYLAQAPEINGVTPTSGYPGQNVTFFATVYGTSPMIYEWDFGGGATPNTSGNASPQVTLGDEGTYNASLTVTNEHGSDYYPFTLSVGPENIPPTAELVTNPASGDAPLLVYLDASGSYDLDGTIVKYEFDFDEGAGWQDYGASDSAEHTYNVQGTYHPKVRVTDNYAATDVDEATVIVAPPPPPQDLVLIPEAVTHDIDIMQVFYYDPVIRRNPGKYFVPPSPGDPNGHWQNDDDAAFADILKTNGDEFILGSMGVWPGIAMQEGWNPTPINSMEDHEIAGVFIRL